MGKDIGMDLRADMKVQPKEESSTKGAAAQVAAYRTNSHE